MLSLFRIIRNTKIINGQAREILVLITSASNEGTCESAQKFTQIMDEYEDSTPKSHVYLEAILAPHPYEVQQ